jgi:hypothetical protein
MDRGEILDVKKSAVERLHVTFERFADDLAEGLSSDGPMDAERAALRIGRIREDALHFAAHAASYRDTRAFVRQVEEARWALQVHRSSHPRASSVDFARRLVDALDSAKAP